MHTAPTEAIAALIANAVDTSIQQGEIVHVDLAEVSALPGFDSAIGDALRAQGIEGGASGGDRGEEVWGTREGEEWRLLIEA